MGRRVTIRDSMEWWAWVNLVRRVVQIQLAHFIGTLIYVLISIKIIHIHRLRLMLRKGWWSPVPRRRVWGFTRIEWVLIERIACRDVVVVTSLIFKRDGLGDFQRLLQNISDIKVWLSFL
jgi:hypothetical protein